MPPLNVHSQHRSSRAALARGAVMVLLLASAVSAAIAAPRITVSDLDFGTVSPGTAAGRVLTICNDGSDTLRLINTSGGEVITWSSPEFRIATKSLEQLRGARIAPGRCTTITVTFLAMNEGQYRTTARVWSNAAGGKDTSAWTTRVVGHRLSVTNIEFGRHRLASDARCAGGSGHAVGTLRLANIGASSVTIRDVRVGTGSDVFAVDTGAQGLHPGDRLVGATPTDTSTVWLRVSFRPQQEIDYTGSIVITTTDSVTVIASLFGAGIEAHVELADTLVLPDASIQPGSHTRATTMVRSVGTHPVTIRDVATTDGAEYTVVSPEASALPVVVQPGEVLPVVVEFTPKVAGPRHGQLVLRGDFSRCDDSTVVLEGMGTGEASVDDDAVVEAPGADVSLRPNPARDHVTIVTPNHAWIRAEVYDLLGRSVAAWECLMCAGEEGMDVRGVAPGEYVVRVQTPRGVTSHLLHVVR